MPLQENLHARLEAAFALPRGSAEQETLLSDIRKEAELDGLTDALDTFLAEKGDAILSELEQVNAALDTLTIRQRLGDTAEILPISYIARHYFGKTGSWLHQRINGYPVRGKVYTLKGEDAVTFNHALDDLAERIKAAHIPV